MVSAEEVKEWDYSLTTAVHSTKFHSIGYSSFTVSGYVCHDQSII